MIAQRISLRDYLRDCFDIFIERFIRGYFEVRFLEGLHYFSNVFGCFLFMLGVRCVLCAFHSTSCLHAPLLLIADGFLFLWSKNHLLKGCELGDWKCMFMKMHLYEKQRFPKAPAQILKKSARAALEKWAPSLSSEKGLPFWRKGPLHI